MKIVLGMMQYNENAWICKVGNEITLRFPLKDTKLDSSVCLVNISYIRSIYPFPDYLRKNNLIIVMTTIIVIRRSTRGSPSNVNLLEWID